MVARLLLLLLALTLPGLAREPFGEGENFPGPPTPRAEQSPAPSLKDQLLERAWKDQAARAKWLSDPSNEELREAVLRVDADNTDWLRSQVDAHGWPRLSEVGTGAARAAFLLAQHSADQGFQRHCLELMTPLVKEQEVNAVDWAYLLDRVRLAEGKKQIYGSQVVLGPDGKLEVAPLEDPEQVDARRAELGMPPIAEYLELVEDMYRSRQEK